MSQLQHECVNVGAHVRECCHSLCIRSRGDEVTEFDRRVGVSINPSVCCTYAEMSLLAEKK